MKNFVIYILFILISVTLHAQWLSNGGGIYYNSGSVSIGTTSPYYQSRLHVKALPSNNNPWTILSEAHSNRRITGVGHNGTAGIVAVSYLGSEGFSPLQFWTENIPRMTIDVDGKVGLGTTSPFEELGNSGLHISNGVHSSILLGDPKGLGYGGILQTSDSKHRVFIGANLYDDEVSGWKNFQAGKGGAGISVLTDQGSWGTSISFYASEDDNVVEPRMSIYGNGNIGIGTTPCEDCKLDVNGKIRSEEIKVEVVNGPDYVFEPDYDLLTLEETKAYIEQNKHLPEIPSAKEMEANGINVGEMNMKLLKKIEEMTLHQIELMERLERVERELKDLKEPKQY